ncbi:MAG: hypothetical protein ACI83P_002757 [Janthinobacterium sp.]|jgi:hypothetical protein
MTWSEQVLPFGPAATPYRKGKNVIVRCEINLYSGLSNPSWELTPEQAEDMLARLATLPEVTHGTLEEKLGYSGIYLTATGSIATGLQSVAAHLGKVRVRTRDGRESWHLDRNRALERTLFQSGKNVVDSDILALIDCELGP